MILIVLVQPEIVVVKRNDVAVQLYQPAPGFLLRPDRFAVHGDEIPESMVTDRITRIPVSEWWDTVPRKDDYGNSADDVALD